MCSSGGVWHGSLVHASSRCCTLSSIVPPGTDRNNQLTSRLHLVRQEMSSNWVAQYRPLDQRILVVGPFASPLAGKVWFVAFWSTGFNIQDDRKSIQMMIPCCRTEYSQAIDTLRYHTVPGSVYTNGPCGTRVRHQDVKIRLSWIVSTRI